MEHGVIKLNVSLTVKAMLSKYIWKLEMMGNARDLENSIFDKKSIRYKLTFPFRTILPKITKIIVNDEIICSNPLDVGLITEISLEHTLKFTPINIETDIFPNEIDYDTSNDDISIGLDRAMVTTKKSITINFNPLKNNPNILNRYNDVCGKPIMLNPLVVNGKSVIRGKFPWLVAIYKRIPATKGLTFHCSGSLVTSQHVITANHCIKENRQDIPIRSHELLVFLGKYNLSNWREQGSIIAEIKYIHMHPDYRKTEFGFDSDIAILTLAFPISFTPYIKPICMNFDFIVRENFGTVVGWGVDRNMIAEEPKEVSMRIVSQEECLRSNAVFVFLTSNTTFCAGNLDSAGPCNGDSGAGIYVKDQFNQYFLRGIVSLSLQDKGSQKCDLEEYTIFTNIIYFKKWILNILSTN
ncbi:serine protease gd-like [Chrysoperla carnea]|uniref:serine protease gd-like n=1 Tax=Chrysoperla carnea TaxID=189513 RepID=UPI001D0923D6|nr:serine protease gd-like [Chrysoperla carnea]